MIRFRGTAAVERVRLQGLAAVVDRMPHGGYVRERYPGGARHADETTLVAEFNAARAAEWAEFASECDKFEAEIAKERRINKLTVAELDEEEHSLERLRRWWRELRARDIFTVPDGVHAEERLKQCEQVLDAYADEVYRAVHAPLGQEER